MTARLAAATLALEAFLVFFATLVASRLTDLPGGVVWGGGIALAVLCVLGAGVVRRPGGLVVGSVIQVLVLLTGVLVPAMWVLGALFVALWCWMLWLGRRIDRDRAAWAQAEGSGSPGAPSSGQAPDAVESG